MAENALVYGERALGHQVGMVTLANGLVTPASTRSRKGRLFEHPPKCASKGWNIVRLMEQAAAGVLDQL